MKLHKIDVDWDIYQTIEKERRGFDEPQYVALRRLLRLPELENTTPSPLPTLTPPPQGRIGVPWVEDGVQVPHGSDARMRYLRGSQVYEGRFLDGKLVVDGREFDTLSAAANALAVTRSGGKTQLNGWSYWEARFPGETEWRSLKEMREAARNR